MALFARGILALSFLLATAGVGLAQCNTTTTTIPLPLDHFKAYQATGPVGPTVTSLTDQFGLMNNVILGPVIRFMTPAQKNTEHQYDPVTHLTCYALPQTTMCKKVLVNNQFDMPLFPQQIWLLQNTDSLCVPTEKNPFPPPKPLPRDHFKCYRATGPLLPLGTYNLTDQFGPQTVQVLNPVIFCNPVRKVYAGKTTPINNPPQHLACYLITPPTPPPGFRPILNQFGAAEVNIGPSQLLCVPSLKTELLPCP